MSISCAAAGGPYRGLGAPMRLGNGVTLFGIAYAESAEMRTIGSNSRVPLQAGHRLGFDSLSSPNTKSHVLQRAGKTCTCCPRERAERIAWRRSSSTWARLSPSSRATDETERGSFVNRSMRYFRNISGCSGICRARDAQYNRRARRRLHCKHEIDARRARSS